MKEDWATAGPFKKGGFNGEYKNLKFGNDPNLQAKLYNKSSPNGSPITRAIKNKLKGGRAMGHCTAFCNLNNKPGNPEEFYDGDLHGDLDGGILAHGLNPFCTVQGHKPDSHINGVWLVALARLLMGIQHVHKTHKQDLDKSNGWIAIIVYFEDDPEFDKIRKFPEGCQWAKIMQPGYSLEPMAVSEEQHILLVHIDNIPDFFQEIAGHPRLIPPRTLQQKKETRSRWFQRWYNEGRGKEYCQQYGYEWDHKRAMGKRFNTDGIISGTTKAVGKNTNRNTIINGISKGLGKNTISNTISSGNYQRRHKTSLTLVPPGYYLSLYNVIVGRSIILILFFKIILPHVLI